MDLLTLALTLAVQMPGVLVSLRELVRPRRKEDGTRQRSIAQCTIELRIVRTKQTEPQG